MKCIGDSCPYFGSYVEEKCCMFMNESYEIIDNECYLESHIECETYSLERSKNELLRIKELQ